jgi:hypothetical protein
LGFFNFKEKKEIKSRIENDEQPKLIRLTKEAESKREKYDKEINKKILEVEKQTSKQEKELSDCRARIKAIDKEFTKKR